jgi:biopolymer transport protein ExbD
MSKFSNKRGKEPPKVSTASLPDIVFMLLFFFMVTTVLRDAELKVTVSVPNASELTKLEQKSLVHYLYLGRPTKKYQDVYGTKPTLQLGDKISKIDDIPLFIEKHKIKVSESQHGRITSSLRVDGDVTMGIVQDVKTKLRKSNQLRVNYSAKPKQN